MQTATANPEPGIISVLGGITTNVLPPTPAEFDTLLEEYETLEAACAAADELLTNARKRVIFTVQSFGARPAGAEKSRRLEGLRLAAMVTVGDTSTLKQNAVAQLKDAMIANKHRGLFDTMFESVTEYRRLKDAEQHFRAASMSQRLYSRLLQMYAACSEVKAKSPALKVERLAAKVARKPHAARKQAA
jgi:hypothetical protein